MKDNLTTTVNKQRHPRRPIKYWECYQIICRDERGNYTGQLIDTNNSIAILRAKYGPAFGYRAIR